LRMTPPQVDLENFHGLPNYITITLVFFFPVVRNNGI